MVRLADDTPASRELHYIDEITGVSFPP